MELKEREEGNFGDEAVLQVFASFSFLAKTLFTKKVANTPQKIHRKEHKSHRI